MSKEPKRTSRLVVQTRAFGSSGDWQDKSGLHPDASTQDAFEEMKIVEKRQENNGLKNYSYRIIRRTETVI